MKSLILRIDESLHEQLKEIASADKRSLANLIVFILSEYAKK